jgi:hypothetical protein
MTDAELMQLLDEESDSDSYSGPPNTQDDSVVGPTRAEYYDILRNIKKEKRDKK